MSIVSEYSLEAVADSSRSTADAARNVYDQRMIRIYSDSLLIKLSLESGCCDSIAEEERQRILIIYKVAHRIHIRKSAAFLNCLGIVIIVLNDIYPLASEEVLLPLTSVS